MVGGRSAHPDTPSRRYSISLYTMQSACRGRSTKGAEDGVQIGVAQQGTEYYQTTYLAHYLGKPGLQHVVCRLS